MALCFSTTHQLCKVLGQLIFCLFFLVCLEWVQWFSFKCSLCMRGACIVLKELCTILIFWGKQSTISLLLHLAVAISWWIRSIWYLFLLCHRKSIIHFSVSSCFLLTLSNSRNRYLHNSHLDWLLMSFASIVFGRSGSFFISVILYPGLHLGLRELKV